MLPKDPPEKVNWRDTLPEFFPYLRKRLALSKISPTLRKEFCARDVIREAESARFKRAVSEFTKNNPRLALIFAGLGGISFALALVTGFEISNADSEIAFRREQLDKPLYELTGSESINFPWDKHNLKEWLYRPVQITGRPMHYKAMLIPRVVEGYNGFDYIVPLVTKENEDGSEQEGILLNKGWMPHEYAHIGSRWRIENALPQTFTCYLSLNSELDEKSQFFKKGNAPQKRRNTWGHVYLPDMAKASGFKNEDAVKLALLERVNPKSPLDERNPKHWEMDLIVSEDYPYEKTKSGALQLKRMPWDLHSDQTCYLTTGTLLTGIAAALKFIH